MRHRAGDAIGIAHDDVRAIGAGETRDRSKRVDDGLIELGLADVDERRRDARDELLEFETMMQRLLRAASLAGVDGDDDEIGDRAGEVFFFDAPEPHRADVLMTDDAGDVAEAADGRVDDGGDAE